MSDVVCKHKNQQLVDGHVICIDCGADSRTESQKIGRPLMPESILKQIDDDMEITRKKAFLDKGLEL